MSDSPATTLITGGAGLIGRATAVRLAAREQRLILVDVDERGLAETASAIHDAGREVETFVLDVRDRGAIDRMSADVDRQGGRITKLFSNVRLTHRGRVSEQTLEDWEAELTGHLTGTFHICQALLPSMVEQREGAIVLNSSDAAIVGLADRAGFASVNAALHALTKSLAVEFGAYGIRVNAVGPGLIEPLPPPTSGGVQEWETVGPVLEHSIPMGRLGRPDEVAAVIDFLLSDRASYITGQLVQPNGGRTMW